MSSRPGQNEGHELPLGYDTRLLRKVWIRKLPPSNTGTGAASPSTWQVDETALAERKTRRDESWDAFEAPSANRSRKR
jgi:hypothetical protein